jgi:hypothetical protein
MKYRKRVRIGSVLGAALALVSGCAGHAATGGGGGGSAGSGNAGAGQAGTEQAGAGQGGNGQAGAANGACRAALNQVNALGGPPCPAQLCAANAWAADCTTLPPEITRTVRSYCDDTQVITLERSGEPSKACYYRRNESSEPMLFAAEAWDDSRSECGGHLMTEGVPTVCGPSAAPMPLCDRAAHQVSEPPDSCFDAFSGACGKCCPTTQPDCTKEPDGYPGYACVSQQNSFCSCTCQQGMWSCAC